MLMPMGRAAPPLISRHARLLIALVAALVVGILVCTHRSNINGPWYWRWDWRFIPWQRYWMMLPCAVPFAAAQWLGARRSIAIGLLVLCSMQLRLTYTLLHEEQLSLNWLAKTVRSPMIVSYYSDAAAIAQDPNWLADYPQILPLTNLHTCSKPPGPVAYYMAWIKAFGYGDRSAALAGLGVIILESLVVPLVYLFARSLSQDADVGFAAASFIVLCPGAVLTAPMLDPVYAGWSCLILLAWDRTLRSGALVVALLCGTALAAGLFCNYSLLALAPFALIQALLTLKTARPVVRLLRLILVAAIGFAVFYGVFWAFTGFDPVATFHSAWLNQHKLLTEHHDQRPYPTTILFDLTDFALSMGWVGLVIAAMGASRAAGHRRADWRSRWLPAACLVQPVIVAISGQLQSETLRVWNFMLPLTALAAGVELVHWSPRSRSAVYAAMFLVLLAIGQNMNV